MEGKRKLNCFCLVLLLVLPSLVSAGEKDVLRALEKIKGSAEAGVTYLKYMDLVADAKVEINIYKRAKPQNECFLQEIGASYSFYELAGSQWKLKIDAESEVEQALQAVDRAASLGSLGLFDSGKKRYKSASDKRKRAAKGIQKAWQEGGKRLDEAYKCLAGNGKRKDDKKKKINQ